SYHGRPATLDELRAATRTGRDGVDAAGLVDAAGRYGLDARGVRVELDGLKHLERGSILHWELSHFVVLEKLHRDGSADIIDPAVGRYRVPRERLAKSFTGVAIVFQPTAMSTVLDGATVSLYLVVIALQSTLMAGIVLALGAIQVTALLLTQSRNQRLMSETLQAQSRAQGYLVQILAGIETLKALGAE